MLWTCRPIHAYVWPRGNGRAGQCDRLCGLARIIVSIPVSRAFKSALFTRNWIPVFTFFIVFQFLILIFVTSPIKRRRTYYLKGVYLDVLSSMFPNFATSELYKKTSNSRCPCRLYSYASCASNGTGRHTTYNTAWAFSLLILMQWAMRRPGNVGWAGGTVPTHFLYICTIMNKVCI